MTKHLTATIAAAGLALSLAAPAVAALPSPGDARFAVPAGKVEHTVRIDLVDGPKAIPSHTKTESWLSVKSARVVVTDLRTGKVTADSTRSAREGLHANSAAFEAAVQKAYVDEGYVRVVGETVVNGRRALITQNAEGGKWRSDNPSSTTTAVVDAQTFTLYERTTELPGSHRHVQTFEKTELLNDPNARAARLQGGGIEHTVVVRKLEGPKAVASHERTERWLTSTSSRVVVTDLTTGKVRVEIATTPRETRIWEAESNTVRVIRSKRAQKPPYTTAAQDAAVQKRQLEQGITRVIGEKLVAGRRALVVESVPGKWRSDEPGSRTVATIDAETFAIYDRTTELPGSATQTEVVERSEMLPASAKARLAMAKHPGVKVRR